MTWLADRTLAYLRDLPDLPASSDRYAFADEIGRGGMGVVFRAVDRELGREVAVKVLHTSTPGLTERLRREARILARLEHPGILPIHDIGTLADGRVFYVMKLVRGERLDQYATQDATLSERLRIIDRLCDAVAFAHAHGVIHRDLKPENVMIGAFGEVLVLDWGVAKARDNIEHVLDGCPAPPGTQHGDVLGTPGYMPPEQAAGRAAEVDERADVFAIGGILAFLAPDGPRALKAIANRARHPDPAQRYPSAAALAADIQRYAAGLAVQAYRENMLERARRLGRKYRVPIVLVAAYLVVRIILLLVTGA
jgi:serine/threonine protein kinase